MATGSILLPQSVSLEALSAWARLAICPFKMPDMLAGQFEGMYLWGHPEAGTPKEEQVMVIILLVIRKATRRIKGGDWVGGGGSAVLPATSRQRYPD